MKFSFAVAEMIAMESHTKQLLLQVTRSFEMARQFIAWDDRDAVAHRAAPGSGD